MGFCPKGIFCRYLPDAKALIEENLPSGTIAEIKNDGRLSIHYSNAGLSIEYIVDDERLQRIIIGRRLTKEDKKGINGLLHKLRRINTRNRITHEVLERILDCQRDYFETNNELRLKPLRVSELARVISKKNNGGVIIDISKISRVIRGISVITPQGNELALRVLFPTGRDIIPFTSSSVKNNAPRRPGVYELRLDNAKIDYPNGSCEILYIGSGRNLRKRLLSHLSPNTKNGGIRDSPLCNNASPKGK
ncbi:hypothetical protein M1N89_01110 [Dehalococcoidia bacterium]|nr:hypothetical protein [Dehalococcoidia bacterium]